jgi:hypothetical protein
MKFHHSTYSPVDNELLIFWTSAPLSYCELFTRSIYVGQIRHSEESDSNWGKCGQEKQVLTMRTQTNWGGYTRVKIVTFWKKNNHKYVNAKCLCKYFI